MSASMQRVGVTPPSVSYYPPPEWLVREIDTRSRPRRTVRFPAPPHSAHARRLTAPSVNARDRALDGERARLHIKTFACGLAAIAWTSFVIAAAVRLDLSDLGQWRDRLISFQGPMLSLAERLEAATTAIGEVSRQILMTAVIVSDSTGTKDRALPLFVKVTNSAPGTEIILSGLAAGTTVTSGTSIGAREWRINIAELPNAYVIPPHGYLGLMTLFAELRDVEGRSLSRVPVHLTWNAADQAPSNGDNNEAAAGELPVNIVASAVDPQSEPLTVQPLDQPTEKVALPKPRPIKHASFAPKSKPKKQMAMAQANKHRTPRRDLNVEADTRWASGELPPYSLLADPRSERQATLEQIFRGLFDNGRHADNCALVRSKQGGQRQLKNDCESSR